MARTRGWEPSTTVRWLASSRLRSVSFLNCTALMAVRFRSTPPAIWRCGILQNRVTGVMRISVLRPSAIAGLVWVMIVSGCGSTGPELADVKGTVTLDGRPLHGATITFRPQGEKGTASYGGTNKDGVYTLMFTRDKNGAMPGEYFVDVETQKPSKSELADNKAQGLPEPPPFVPIPKKYRGAEQLKATVKSGSNTIDFPLDTK